MKVSGKKLLYAVIFMAMFMSLTLYYMLDTMQKIYEIHQCSHQLVDASVSINKKTERNLKETQHAVSNSEDREKFELIAENLELMWQNEKLIRELLNMFNLLRGREMPLSRPSGKTNI